MEIPEPLNIPTPASADGGGKDETDGEEMEEATHPPVERETRDTDSTYSDDVGGTIAHYQSVTESIYNFRLENGRTYHAYGEGKYYVPNDEKEQYRMDVIYHSLMWMFDGKFFLAPVENPQRIVDMGTGTGVWALDVGDQFPSAHVVGIDLSPIQPRWCIPNVDFRVDDIELPWVFEQPLDLIHDALCSGNAIRDWPKYLSESYRCLRPGGWVEAHEFYLEARSDDDSFPPNSALLKWHHEFHRGMMLGGCNMRVSAKEIKEHMQAAGFVNVQTVEWKWPMSPWCFKADRRLAEAGYYAMTSMTADLEGLSQHIFTKMLGWDIKDLENLLAKVNEEWHREDVHSYWPLFAVYGQKPQDP